MFGSCFNNLKTFKNIFLILPHFTIPANNANVKSNHVSNNIIEGILEVDLNYFPND